MAYLACLVNFKCDICIIAFTKLITKSKKQLEQLSKSELLRGNLFNDTFDCMV